MTTKENLGKVALTFGGQSVEVFVIMDVQTQVGRFGHYQLLNGDKLFGLWKHGTYGKKAHRELVTWDDRGKGIKLESMCTYHSGSATNAYKYLLAFDL